MTTEILHRIDRPFAEGTIEVYAQEAGAASYEWRIIDRGAVIADSQATGYGSPAVALRDALNYDEPPLPQPAQEAAYAVYVRGVVVATHDDRATAEAAWQAADKAFVEALVGIGWPREDADLEAEIHISLAIR